MACFFGHKWNGCKCTKCGMLRDQEHAYASIPGKCEQRCGVCGKEIPATHRWNGYLCEVCGATRDGKEPLEEIYLPDQLRQGDTVRLFSESLPYTMQAGWFGEPQTVSSIDLDKKRIFLTTGDGNATDRGFGDTFYGYSGSRHMHCYKVAQGSPDQSSAVTKADGPHGLTALELIDYLVAHRAEDDFLSNFAALTAKLQDEFHSNPQAVEKAIATFGDSEMVNRYKMIRSTMQPSDLALLMPDLAVKYVKNFR